MCPHVRLKLNFSTCNLKILLISFFCFHVKRFHGVIPEKSQKNHREITEKFQKDILEEFLTKFLEEIHQKKFFYCKFFAEFPEEFS